MKEDQSSGITELESEVKKLRQVMQQWENLERRYRKSNEELQQSLVQLKSRQEKTDLALLGGDLAWWEWDYKSGRVIFNENRYRLLGYQPGELPENYSGITALIHPDDYQSTMDKLQEHLRGEHANYEAEFRLQTKSGEWRWFFDKGKIVETDIFGKPVRLSGVLIDIHERKSIENLLIIARDKADAESKAKSNFLANMSHEIYTPMAGVIGMAEILKQSKLNQEQEEYLNVIVKSATNLMSVLNDIIEFSKMEAGNVELHEKPFSIHQVVEEVTASFVDKASEKNIAIQSFQDPDIPVEVIGDPVRLRQILKIFTDNALKFTEEGQITIEAHFLAWDQETVKVRFLITDTGIGISPEGKKRLFTSFNKTDSAESRKYGGGGLGLAIAKRLIDRMNGHISVESEPGLGTTFAIVIIFERYRDSETGDSMKEMLQGCRTLLLDPEISRRGILARYLDHWEAEVDETGSIEEAMQKIEHQSLIKKPYNLIVIEKDLENTDGLELAKSWRHNHTIQKSIVILTASRDYSFTSAELSSSGVMVALQQPYKMNRLKSRLREALTKMKRELPESYEGPEPGTQDQKKSLSILLAEDNQINQKVALVILEKIGYSADLAADGRIALEKYKEKSYDLILMDIMMPEMDGYEATRNIRLFEQENPGRIPAHICAITANRSQEDEDKCFKSGMNSFITKPFHLEELTKILNQL